MKLVHILLFMLLAAPCTAQDNAIAEVRRQLKQNVADTARVTLLNNLAGLLMRKSQPELRDTILKVIQSAHALSIKSAYLDGRFYATTNFSQVYSGNDPANSQHYAKTAIAMAKKTKRKDMEALGYMVYAQAVTTQEQQLSYGEKAVVIAREAGDKKILATLLNDLAILYNDYADFRKSIACATEASKYYNELKLGLPVDLYGYLADSYTNLGIYELGIKYGLKAIEVGERTGASENHLFNYYNNVATAYYYIHNWEQSEKYSRKALQSAIKRKDTTAVYVGAYSIATDIYKQPGRAKEAKELMAGIMAKYKCKTPTCRMATYIAMIHVHDELGERTHSERYCREMLQYIADNREELTDYDLNAMYTSATIHYYTLKDYARARTYLEETKKTANTLGIAKSRTDAYKMEFQLDSIQGNLMSAIRNYQAYVALKDSVFNEVKSNQISHYQTAYESVKKDESIKSLTLARELAQARLDRQKIWVIITILLLIIVAVVAGAFYLRSKHRKKHNQDLERKQVEIEDKNASLSKLIQEKEWLLKEIHHRVKNNLQIVMSLLNSQSYFLKDKAALMAIRDSQHRVNSISLIHQKLYQSENLASIAMNDYIHELVLHLKESFCPENISFEVIIEKVDFDVSQAVPIGLILNEAITNAIKYAFPAGAKGKIKITLSEADSGMYTLTVSDNGVGMRQDFDIATSTSLGMSLINGLTEDINGQLTLSGVEGTSVSIKFHKDNFMEDAFHGSQSR